MTQGAPEMTSTTLVWMPLAAVPQPTVEIGFTVVADATDQIALNRNMHVDLDIPSDVASCVLVTNGGTGPMLQGLRENVPGAMGTSPSFPGIAPPQALALWHTFDAGGGSCTLDQSIAHALVPLANATNASTPTGPATALSLSVDYFTVSLQYTLLYQFTP